MPLPCAACGRPPPSGHLACGAGRQLQQELRQACRRWLSRAWPRLRCVPSTALSTLPPSAALLQSTTLAATTSLVQASPLASEQRGGWEPGDTRLLLHPCSRRRLNGPRPRSAHLALQPCLPPCASSQLQTWDMLLLCINHLRGKGWPCWKAASCKAGGQARLCLRCHPAWRCLVLQVHALCCRQRLAFSWGQSARQGSSSRRGQER